MKYKYKPREDIYEYLTTTSPGTFPPDCLHLKKPTYNEDGVYTAAKGEVVVNVPALMHEIGLSNITVPTRLFLEICEHVLQMYEKEG